jgi:hypothetical protein
MRFAALCLLLFTTSILPATITVRRQENTSQLKKLAEECIQSLVSGNLDRFADLTYPKVVKISGGKEKMKRELEKGQKEMKADGYGLISAQIGKIGDIVKVGSERFVIVEYVLKTNVPNGYLVRDSFLLGVASVNEDWTFVDGVGLHRPEAKKYFPEIIGKIALPPPRPPVFHQSIKE